MRLVIIGNGVWWVKNERMVGGGWRLVVGKNGRVGIISCGGNEVSGSGGGRGVSGRNGFVLVERLVIEWEADVLVVAAVSAGRVLKFFFVLFI